jgi:hypothetical protein
MAKYDAGVIDGQTFDVDSSPAGPASNFELVQAYRAAHPSRKIDVTISTARSGVVYSRP